MTFAKHDRVKWKLKDGTEGRGRCASAESEGSVLVAVDPLPPDSTRKLAQSSLEFHPVIYCTTTWLEHDEPAIVPDPKPTV